MQVCSLSTQVNVTIKHFNGEKQTVQESTDFSFFQS